MKKGIGGRKLHTIVEFVVHSSSAAYVSGSVVARVRTRSYVRPQRAQYRTEAGLLGTSLLSSISQYNNNNNNNNKITK